MHNPAPPPPPTPPAGMPRLPPGEYRPSTRSDRLFRGEPRTDSLGRHQGHHVVPVELWNRGPNSHRVMGVVLNQDIRDIFDPASGEHNGLKLPSGQADRIHLNQHPEYTRWVRARLDALERTPEFERLNSGTSTNPTADRRALAQQIRNISDEFRALSTDSVMSDLNPDGSVRQGGLGRLLYNKDDVGVSLSPDWDAAHAATLNGDQLDAYKNDVVRRHNERVASGAGRTVTQTERMNVSRVIGITDARDPGLRGAIDAMRESARAAGVDPGDGFQLSDEAAAWLDDAVERTDRYSAKTMLRALQRNPRAFGRTALNRLVRKLVPYAGQVETAADVFNVLYENRDYLRSVYIDAMGFWTTVIREATTDPTPPPAGWPSITNFMVSDPQFGAIESFRPGPQSMIGDAIFHHLYYEEGVSRNVVSAIESLQHIGVINMWSTDWARIPPELLALHRNASNVFAILIDDQRFSVVDGSGRRVLNREGGDMFGRLYHRSISDVYAEINPTPQDDIVVNGPRPGTGGRPARIETEETTDGAGVTTTDTTVRLPGRRGSSGALGSVQGGPGVEQDETATAGDGRQDAAEEDIELEISQRRTVAANGTATSEPTRVRVITRGTASTEIHGSQIAQIFGSNLARLVGIDNPLAAQVVSTTAGVLAKNLYQEIDDIFGRNRSVGFDDFGKDLASAGIGAVSSLLAGELVAAIGLDGLEGQVSGIVIGSVIGKIAKNVFDGAKGVQAFNGIVDLTQIGTAVGSFIGTTLASRLVKFESIGGQLGSAIGSAVGSYVLAATFAKSFGSLGMAAGPLGAAVGAFVGFIVGGLIGSVFGGTPRSGADAAWDPAKQEFVVANAYSRKGGSKDAAVSVATAVATTLNAVLEVSGSRLLDPLAVQSGNYGMRGSSFVYRPESTRDKDAITRRFSGEGAGNKLVNYGVYQALTDPDFRLAGGNVFVKRALSGSLALASASGQTAENLPLSAILGDLSVGRDFSYYFENRTVLSGMIATMPDNAMSIGWATTIARGFELGLHRRAASDWHGGYSAWLDQLADGAVDGHGLVASQITAYIEEDTGERSWEVTRRDGAFAGYVLDAIDVSDITAIEGTAGADEIRLGAGHLLASSGAVNAGLTIHDGDDDAAPHDGSALAIDVAATIHAGAGDDLVQASDRGDNVFGGSGNDRIYGGRLDDWLFGGEGDDLIAAGSQVGGPGGDGNHLDGGSGNDTLRGGEGSDWLEGGDGTDIIDGGGGNDILTGGAGALDQVKGGHGDDQYLVRRGDGADEADEVAAGAPVTNLTGGTGDAVRDRFTLLANSPSLRNWSGRLLEIAKAAAIRISEGAAAPGAVASVDAGGEDSIVLGQGIGMGDIRLKRSQTAAEAADPQSTTTTGSDLIVQVLDAAGQPSGTQLVVRDWFTNPFKRVEWLKFADGNEIRIADVETFIVGTEADDILNGTEGRDFVYGGGGNDHIRLFGGDDIGSGGTGNDAVWGDGERDLLIGGLGRDKLYGGTESDTLSGDAGDDELMGEDGADVLSGGRGDDWIVGGAGTDTIKFSRGDGHDTVVAEVAATSAPADDPNWRTIWSGGYWSMGYDQSWIDWDQSFRWVTENGVRALQWYSIQPTRVFEASDSIEFDIGIDIQDVLLIRDANHLVVAISDADGEAMSAAADSITIKDWYKPDSQSQWSTERPVGRFAFYQTGALEVATEGWTLVAGTDGVDSLSVSALGITGRTWLTAGGGDDLVEGGGLNDILAGNGGFDEIHGGGGGDVLYGGAGDDVLAGGGGGDMLVGGEGLDTASYAGSAGVYASLADPGRNSADAAGDVYSSIENIAGGAGSDVLVGDEMANILSGAGGSDRLRGGAGDDTYVWEIGDGDDVVEEGVFAFAEVVTASGSLAPGYRAEVWSEPAYRSTHWDLFIYDSNNVAVYSHHVTSSATYSKDRPWDWPMAGWTAGFASTGNGHQVAKEELGGGGGIDVIEMGEGISLADLGFERLGDDLVIRHAQGGSITLRNHFGTGGRARVDTLQFADGQSVALETVVAATAAAPDAAGNSDVAQAELITGTSGSNVLSGHGGNDTVSGGAGNDSLDGGEGNDVLEGGADGDSIVGSAHGAAADDPTGWGDTARYASSPGAVQVDLAAGTGSGGHAQGDTLSGIEHVVGSRDGGDTLTGDSANNRLFGLGGDDTLSGGDGNDVLVGADGVDTLSGGDGDDNLEGGDGNDRLYGGTGTDSLFGGGGDDLLKIGVDVPLHPSVGVLDGGGGNDTLHGAGGKDTLVGGAGDDSINAGAGDDKLEGGDGIDILNGGSGLDVLVGGAGDDKLYGGADADEYAFGADTGSDEIVDSEGANRILFSEVERDRLWLTQSGNDLVVRVIGGTSQVTVRDYFTAPGTATRELVFGSSSLFLRHAGTAAAASSLIGKMTGTPMPASVGAVPADIATLRDSLWVPGGKAVPKVVDQSLTIDERAEPEQSRSVSGAVGAVDQDDNITGYSVAAGPLKGALSLDSATGAWTYTPTLYANGADSFIIRTTDAHGHTADQNVSLQITPANSTPVFGAVQPTLAIDENAAAGTVLGTISARDPDDTDVTFLDLPDSSPFAISDGGVITLKQGFALDYETARSWVLAVQVTDGQITISRNFTVTVNDIEERPSAPQLVGTPVTLFQEGTAPGTEIAQFTATDPDGDVPTFRLRSGSTSIFAISGNRLQFAAGFNGNFETLAAGLYDGLLDRDGDGLKEIEYTAQVESFDGTFASQDSTGVSVLVEDVNEAPTSIAFDSPSPAPERDRPQLGVPLPPVALGLLSVSDPDLGDSHVFTVADDRFEVAAGNVLRLKENAKLDFEGAPADASGRYVDVTVSAADRFGLTVQRTVRIYITDSTDYIYGTAASETLTGTAGRDAIFGREGVDSIHGNAGDDEIYGEVGSDYLYGQAGNDKIYGGADADVITGNDGNDEVYGEAGDDRVDGGLGSDLVDGGDGFDIAVYVNATSAVTVNLATGSGSAGEAAGDTLVSIEGVEASSYADTITGSASADKLYGRNGNDTLTGGAGDDFLYGQANDDTLHGGDGNDTLDGSSENDTIYGGNNNDTIYGGTGNDVLRGEDGEDNIRGDAGNDTIYGGDGNDSVRAAGTDAARGFSWTYLSGGDGDDTIDGGNGDDALIGGLGADALIGSVGFDQAAYTDSSVAVTVNLESGTGLYGTAQGDTLSGIERVLGSTYNDTLIGSFRDDVLDGGSGNDTLDGAAGNDVLFGGSGNDTMSGGAGTDRLEGGSGDDVYNIDDTLDSIVETSTGGSADEVRTSLSNYTLAAFVEKLTGTSAGGQTLQGNTLNNTVAGGSGGDRIWLQTGGSDSASGAAGDDDFILGSTFGAGDAVAGGAGADRLLLQGSYSFALAASSMTGIETLVLLAGSDTSYGGSGTGTFSYSLTLSDGNVALGETLTVDGSQLRLGENLTFSAAAEIDGRIVALGGRGTDLLTGGADSDVFEFANGTWGSADRVTGGGGSDTLRLRGAPALTLGDQLTGIEQIVLLSASTGSLHTYAITASDLNVALGQTMDVSGGELRAGETLSFTAAAETNGSYRITGGAAADTLTGGAGGDTLHGGGDADTLTGGAGGDTATGGDGNDTVYGDSGADVLKGDAGDDTIWGGADDDQVWGGDGNEVLRGEAGADTLHGEAGNDQIEGGDGGDTIDGGDGGDTLKGDAGADSISGGLGDDQIWGGDDGDNVSSGDGNDTVRGEAGVDTLAGGAGDDTIFGGGDGDTVTGDSGVDTLHGEAGADTIDGGDGADTIHGGDDSDSIAGGNDNDTIYGDGANDTIEGGAGDDTLYGGSEDDTLRGGEGSDVLTGDSGNDRLEGGAGDDTYWVTEAGDTAVELAGEGAADHVYTNLSSYTLADNVEKLTGTYGLGQVLRGNALANTIVAGAGNDTIYLHHGGAETASGNAGNDIFYMGLMMGAGDKLDGGDGSDKVVLDGGYTFGLALNATNFTAIESLELLGAADTRYDGSSAGSFSYNLTFNDSNMANGQWFTINASQLAVGENFTMNATAETGAYILVYGGFGNETLTGGGANDMFYFGVNKWTSGDSIDGGAGADTFRLKGIQTIILGATQLKSIEHITFVSGWDPPANPGSNFGYNVTADDGNVVQGATMAVSASELRSGESLVFDASAESDGFYNMTGGKGADRLTGGALNDILEGGEGSDTLTGGAGGDTLKGEKGEDFLYGGAGVDHLHGGDDRDELYGGKDGDWLYGGIGNDFLDAGDDGDKLFGEAGDDTLKGGDGDDTYFVARGDGHDVIDNFDASNGADRLQFTGDITYRHIWFERFDDATKTINKDGKDLRLWIYGQSGDASVTILDWFKPGVAPDLYQLDAITETLGRLAKPIDVWALVTTMQGLTRPENYAQLQTYFDTKADFKHRVEEAWKFLTAPKLEIVSAPASETEPLDGATRPVSYTVRAWYDDSNGNNIKIPADDIDVVLETTDGSPLSRYLVSPATSLPGTDGTRTITAQLSQDFSGTAPLRVRATIRGVVATSLAATSAVPLAVAPTADTATLTKADTTGKQGTSIALNVNATTSDTDGSEQVYVLVEGLPAGYTLTNSAGVPVGTPQSIAIANRAGTSVTAKGAGVFELYKTGTSTWAAAATSAASAAGDFVLRAKSLLGTTNAFVGVNGDPATNDHYNSLDFSVQIYTDGRGYIYEDGNMRLSFPINGQVFIWRTGSTLKYGTGPDFATASTTGVIRSVEGVTGALHFDSSFGSGESRVEAQLTQPPIRLTQAELSGLRLLVPGGRYEDAALKLTAQTVDGASVRNATSQVLNVRVDAQPTAITLRAVGTAAAASINENTPTSATNGVVVGSAIVSDPDSIEANRISTDFNLLPKVGAGEERIVTTVGPDGQLVRALETGQLDGAAMGGGVASVSAGTPDTTKAYKYSVYVKGQDLLGQDLYIGTIGQVQNATTGAADSNPYFISGPSNSIVQDRWYRIEGWVLPAGHALVASNVFGGVFDTTTGQKIANTTAFRFAPGATETGLRFFSYGGNSTPGYSAQWYLPQVEKQDFAYSLQDNAGGRFSINGLTGQISAVGNSFDYEAATSHNVTVRATDSTGLYTDRTFTIAVNNVNERPDPLVFQSETRYSETLPGDAAHVNQVIALFGMSDPDRTTPTLSIIAGDGPGRFATSGNALTFGAGTDFSATWLRANLGRDGIDTGWKFDIDGDGLKEILVATLTLAATDSGGLQGDPFTYRVYIEDKNEAPVFDPQGPHFQLTENAPAGHYVGQVKGSDVDDPVGDLRYYFVNATSTVSPTSIDEKFAINPLTGVVTVNGTTTLDLETTPQLTYQVMVYDRAMGAQSRSNTTLIYIDLQNVNERPYNLAAPTLTPNSETFAGETPHAGKTIATFNPTDRDAGPAPALTILSGNDYGFFAVSGNKITFGSNTNFTADWLRANRGNYSIDVNGWSSDVDQDGLKEIRVGRLTVAAKDSGGLESDPYTFDVLIEDRNEAPLFSEPSLQMHVNENSAGGTAVGSVAATDADGEATDLRYSFLIDGAPSATSVDGKFVMNATTGQVTVNGATPLDFETMPPLSYWVAVRDRALAAHSLRTDRILFINLRDLNEKPGPLVMTGETWHPETLAGESHGGRTIATFSMSDPDGTVPALSIVGGNTYNWFSVSGGSLVFSAGTNFTADWLRQYKGTHGVEADFTLDRDGDGLKEIQVATLTLAARDSGGLQGDPFTYKVFIEDKNEAPRFNDPAYSFYVHENTGNYENVGTIAATDIDGPQSEIRYHFVNGSYYYNSAVGRHVVTSPDNRFIVDTYTGQVFTHGQQALDYEGTRTFSYQVAAYDRTANGPHTVAGTSTYTLNLLNRNDNAPAQPAIQSYGTTVFNENTGAGYTVANLSAPADADGTLTGVYHVLSSNPGNMFEIVGQTLRVRTDRNFDYEAFGMGGSYDLLQVRFYTTDGTHNSSENYVNVQINNVNDNAPTAPLFDVYQTSFAENSGGWQLVATIDGSNDPDGSSNLSYHLTSNPYGMFEIVGYQLRMVTNPDFEALASSGDAVTLRLGMSASDGTYMSAESSLYITITNVNEVTTFTQIASSFTVAENTAYGTVVSDGVRAYDVRGNGVSYWIDAASNPNGAFGINSDGQIVIANGVDYEQGGWLEDSSGKYANLHIFAADDGASAAETTVQVRITNQVLMVRNADGSMAPGWSIHQSSNPYGSGYYGQPYFYTNNLVYYSSTGKVLHESSTSSYPMYSSQPTSAAQIAPGFRITGNGYEFLSDDEFNTARLAPIVFDLLGTGLANAFGTNKVAFDIDGNGATEKLSWLNPGFAFLALDRNGDGRIGSGLEISFTQDKAGARTDLEGLAAFDSNADGKISSADVRFGEFLIWQDSNADGTSQASELKTLTQAGIASIGLAPTPTGRTLANTSGNVTLNTASFTFADGRTGTVGDTVLRAEFGDAADAAAVTFGARDFGRKSGKYMLSVDGGTISIVPAKARGVLDARAGAIGPATMLSFRNRQVGMLAPVVLDLDGDGVELVSSKKARARFDMNGDGALDDTGWVGRGDGFLVIDRDGDGGISGPSELSFLGEKAGAKSDLDALAALDSNRDGKIDSADARFAQLAVWADSNGNGVTDSGELKSLADHGIASIGLSSAANRQTAKIGDNVVLSTGTFTRTDGSIGTLADAALAFRPGRDRSVPDSAPSGGAAAETDSGIDMAELERRLETLRSGIGGPLRLDNLDFPHDRFPTLPQSADQPGVGEAPAEPGSGSSAPVADEGLLDRRTALIAQQMAAFGAVSGEAEWQQRDRPQPVHFDYFAQ